jgi:hypothetical protein
MGPTPGTEAFRNAEQHRRKRLVILAFPAVPGFVPGLRQLRWLGICQQR